MSGAPITSIWGFLHEDPLNSSVAKVVLDLRTQESERGLQGRVESLGWGQKRLVNERPKKQLSVSRYLFVESSGIFLLVLSPLSSFVPTLPLWPHFPISLNVFLVGRERLSSHVLLICLPRAELSFHSWCPLLKERGWGFGLLLLCC